MPSFSSAAVTTYAQVTGFDLSSPAASASERRNQSTLVLAHWGAATTSSCHRADSAALAGSSSTWIR